MRSPGYRLVARCEARLVDRKVRQNSLGDDAVASTRRMIVREEQVGAVSIWTERFESGLKVDQWRPGSFRSVANNRVGQSVELDAGRVCHEIMINPPTLDLIDQPKKVALDDLSVYRRVPLPEADIESSPSTWSRSCA